VKSMNQGGEIEKLTVETNTSCLVSRIGPRRVG